MRTCVGDDVIAVIPRDVVGEGSIRPIQVDHTMVNRPAIQRTVRTIRTGPISPTVVLTWDEQGVGRKGLV
jgi:hypothetical protein